MLQIIRVSTVIALCSALGLAGCSTLAPTYTQPPAPVPASWGQGQPDTTKISAVADMPWQDFYRDPQLRQVIALGLANNRDLRVAALNVERSQAQYRIQWSALVPSVNASGTATYAELSKDFTSAGHSRDSHQYTVGLGVTSYELDLFGRVRSLKDQALEQYLATAQAQRSFQIGLIGQIAAGYLTLSADRELLRLAQETLKTQQESLHLTEQRFAVGSVSELDVRETQTQVESAQVDEARLTAQVKQDEDNLNVLVGAQLPSNLQPIDLKDDVAALDKISPGLSSEVLLQRPDVLQAENVLKGYQANIGAARAAFFPKITLVGSLGSGSSELSGLFTSGSGSWTFVPHIELPIFDAGSRMAQLRVAEVDRDIALAQYEKTIQTAFREVADGLTQRSNIARQLTAQQALYASTEKRYQLARERYNTGVDSHLAVLDAQRSLYSAQQGVINVRLARLTNLVSLYKALGGGVRARQE